MLYYMVLVAMLAFSFGFYNPTITFYLKVWFRNFINNRKG